VKTQEVEAILESLAAIKTAYNAVATALATTAERRSIAALNDAITQYNASTAVISAELNTISAITVANLPVEFSLDPPMSLPMRGRLQISGAFTMTRKNK
jgi:hypothetical protein